MKFVPKALEKTGDISAGQASCAQTFKWIAGFLVAGVLFYIFLGIITDIGARFFPTSLERRLAGIWTGIESYNTEQSNRQELAERLLNDLLMSPGLPDLNYSIQIIDADQPNALAMPGGTILLTEGLFDAVRSEQGLAMVIGHELGHFKNRDHLRSMGRGILLSLAIGVMFGDSDLGSVVQQFVMVDQRRYSRAQERSADELGIELLVAAYGHAGGALEFFEAIREKHSQNAFVEFFSTHPDPEKRIAHLQELIEIRGYPTSRVQPIEKEAN
jgi:predicted Zn-dependent protease